MSSSSSADPTPNPASDPTDGAVRAVHQHRFDRVEDYLHHRPPYLMVDSIERIDDQAIQCVKTIVGDEPFITGHFPGAPVLPGAMMQEMTTQSAGVLIAANFNPMATYRTHDPLFNEYALGVLVKVKSARYRGFARPGAKLNIACQLVETFGNVFDFIGRITLDGKTIMRNEFQLSNIPSATLQGTSS